MVGDLSFSEPLIENSSAVAEMGESLATTDIPMAPLGELGSHHNVAWAEAYPYQVAS